MAGKRYILSNKLATGTVKHAHFYQPLQKMNDILYEDDNTFHQSLRTVYLIISGHQENTMLKRPGYYRSILLDKQTNLYLRLNETVPLRRIQPHQAIIKGLIQTIQLLKQPCHIKIYTKIDFGYKKVIDENDSLLLTQLKTALLDGLHVVEVNIHPEKVNMYFRNYQ